MSRPQRRLTRRFWPLIISAFSLANRDFAPHPAFRLKDVPMAIYTTFFLCKPEELHGGFPGWRPPLAAPVRRQFKNPFTGELSTIETREPEWLEEGEEVFERDYQVVAAEGNYKDYLEGRLPPFIRACPHWAAKGLTEVELGPLADALGVVPTFEFSLYCPPSAGATLQQLPLDMPSKLVSQDQPGLQAIAEKWAARMSTPEYTHSVTGVRLNDGWTASEGMGILRQIVTLARQAAVGQRMYLLIEA
jgi:hypothetical protein